MAQLCQDYDKFRSLNAEILIIGPEDAGAFKKYWEDNDLPFIGLPDPTHSVLELYGQEVNLFRLGRMPAMVIVDPNGTVRFVHYGRSIRDIPENAEVLAALKAFNKPLEEFL